MASRIEIIHRKDGIDAAGLALLRRMKADLNLGARQVRVADIYTIDRELSPEELERCRRELFTDPITQESAVNASVSLDFDWAVEVGFLPGVTDNAGRTAREAVGDLLGLAFADGQAVYFSRRYLIRGDFTREDIARVAALISNPLIHRVRIASLDEAKAEGLAFEPAKVTLEPNFRVDEVELELSDEALSRLGGQGILDRVEADGREVRRGPLALDLPSLYAIRDYFRKLRRKPTDVELESLAQTWSEHCKHTIFACQLDEIDSLYKSTIKRATNEIRRRMGANDYCVSVFEDNSGIISFVPGFNVCYKVETHNSPSALDPYGGALTGIVGVNRDPLGTGLGARLITNMYGFCFGNPFWNKPLPTRKPDGGEPILHPKIIFEGVRLGVEHGGNKSGIPTSWGFLTFDDRYMGKPLVFVGTLGLMPTEIHGRPSHEKRALAGDKIVMAGGRVGADGIHGATFSSESLHAGSPSGAVQIGDPITQKKLGDAQHEALALGLYRSITDNGAGGLSCSVGEMAKESGGCFVELNRVPIKYAGLAPNEIWISESQERMTYAVPPENVAAFLDLYRRRGVEATVIGEFTDSGRCVVEFGGASVMDVELDFLHDGLPRKELTSNWTRPERPEPAFPERSDFTEDLTELLSQLNLCGKEYVVRQYDHEVQAGSVVKPLIGVDGDVHSDASVTRPLLDRFEGVALSSALFPSYGDIDPYSMAACAVDTAIRNQVAVGADPKRVALLDNFCWCSSDEPGRLGELKRAAAACYDMAVAHDAPYISGKDSMFNDFKGFDECGNPLKISVPPTILISSVGFVPDIRRVVTLDAKQAGDHVYLLGETKNELGGGEYFRMLGERADGRPWIGNRVPEADPARTRPLYAALADAIQKGLCASACSVHMGGLAYALARTAMAGGLGLDLTRADAYTETGLSHGAWLFSESQGRFVVTAAPERAARFEEALSGQPLVSLGTVTEDARLRIRDESGQAFVDAGLSDLKHAYKKTLDW